MHRRPARPRRPRRVRRRRAAPAASTSSSSARRASRPREELARSRCWPTRARRHGALLAVNDRADVALAAGAGRAAPRPGRPAGAGAPGLVGDDVAGRPLHPRRGRGRRRPRPSRASTTSASGPTWPTPTKPGRPAPGLDLTRHAARRARPGPGSRSAGSTRTGSTRCCGRRDAGGRGPGDHRGGRPGGGARRCGRLGGAGERARAAARAGATRATVRRARLRRRERDEPPHVRRVLPAACRHRAAGDRAAHPGVRAVAPLAARARPDPGRVRRLGPVRDPRRALDVRPAPDDRGRCCPAGCRWTRCCSSWSPRPARSSPSRRSARSSAGRSATSRASRRPVSYTQLAVLGVVGAVLVDTVAAAHLAAPPPHVLDRVRDRAVLPAGHERDPHRLRHRPVRPRPRSSAGGSRSRRSRTCCSATRW